MRLSTLKLTLSIFIIGFAAIASATSQLTREICVVNKTNREHFKDAHIFAKVTELAKKDDFYFTEDNIIHYLETDNFWSNRSCFTISHEFIKTGVSARSPKTGVSSRFPEEPIKFELTGTYYLQDEHKTRGFSPTECTAPADFHKNSYSAVITANDAGELQCIIEATYK